MKQIDQKTDLKKYLEFLKIHGASDIEHSGEDFLSHLKGTMDILVSWKVDLPITIAGLFHSVYGTEVFKDALIPSDLRPKIQKMIGIRAEKVTYLFGIMIRSHFLSQLGLNEKKIIKNRFDQSITEISDNEFKDLCHIYIANRLEQHHRWPKEYKFSEYEEMKQMKQHLCSKAWDDLSKEYKFY